MNMKPIMNKKGLYALVCALMGLTFGMLTSCSDDLDVQQSYPFTVETMPVPTRIVIYGGDDAGSHTYCEG